MMVGVSSRTRSKKVPLFSSFSLDRSSSKRKKSDEDVMSFESVSGSKRRRVKNRTFVFPKKNHEVIFIEDDDYDEDGSEYCDFDVQKKGKSYESGGSCEFGDKNGSFDDDMCGWESENPITIDGDVRKKTKVDKNRGSGEFVDKDETFVDFDFDDYSDESDDEEEDTSDEDYNVGEMKEISDNDDDSGSDSSFADDVDDDDEDEEEEDSEGEKEKKKKKGSKKYFNVVEELAREVNEQSGDEEEEEEKKKGSRKSFNVVEEKEKKKVDEISDSDDGSSNDVDDDDVEVEEVEKKCLRKPNNVVEEVKEEVMEEKKVNEIFDIDDDDEVVEAVEKNGLRKPNNVVEEVKEEVMEEEKVNEIFDIDDDEEVVEAVEKNGLRKPNNMVEEVKEEVMEEEKVYEIFDIDDDDEVVEKVEKNGLRKPNNVLEEVKEGVREEEKVNEISDSDHVSSNDVIVDDNEKIMDEEKELMEEDKEEVREEVEKKKVNEICVSDDISSNDVVVDDNEEKVRDEEKKDLMEEDEEVREEVEKEKVNEICDSNHVSSNVVIVDDNEEKVRDEEKKGLTKPNNVVDKDKEEIMEEDKGLKKLNNVVEEDEVEKLWKECNNGLMEEEELLREMEDQKSGTSKRNNQKKKIKISPSGYHNVVEHSDYGSATASTTFNPMKGCSSSKPNEASETHKAKNVEMKVENVSHDDDNVNVAKFSAKPTENVKVGSDEVKEQHVKRFMVLGVSSVQTKQGKVKVADSVKGKEQHVKGFGVGGVSSVQTKQEKVEVGSVEGKEQNVNGLGVGRVSSVQIKPERVEDLDKQKTAEDKPGEDYKGGINIQNGVKKESADNNSLNQRVRRSTPSMPKKLPLAQYLAELYRSNKEGTMKNDSTVLEMKDDGVNQKDTPQPPVRAETPSLIWSLKRVVPKTKEQEELDKELEKNKPLWDEMERAMRESEAESEIGNLGTNRSPSPHCEHITLLDEQLGVYCKLCGDVITEIRYITQLVEDRYPNEGLRRRASIGGDGVSLFDRSHLNVSDDDSKDNVSHTEVTVWDKIPGVKQTLYPHQQEGFEFIWKNLAGSIELQKLKNADPRSEGGCIISHAPGTGKTRLTIVFLKAYLKLFPKCLPIVVAPASLLLTWEEEFKKWDIGVPFHNISNVELSGKEHADVCNRFDRLSKRHRTDENRMAKLISWFKETSILGISYSLYGTICQHKETEGNFGMRKVLLETPGLLVLDEGHTPRNQRSHIWKVLKKSQTPKRIILSGTPFQNNFTELYSTLSLVKPSFPDTIPPELKRFCHKQGQRSFKKWGWEAYSGNIERDPSDDDKIEKLKLLMDPFVHVHKGAILESKLPGLKECLVTLKADSLQNDILKSIKRSQNSIFNFERKIALTSVHPSLFLECELSKKEESALDRDWLKQIRLNPHEGVKTKFVYEFVRLCDASNEKVLVFSQFHAPLKLIKDQLNSAFNWSNGEVLFMSSRDSTKEKQSIIHIFNDENSKAKILLAATKACSEGISLVGASRVVLLDVVWNPSVERQAISRAYRIGQKKVVYTYHLLAEGTTETEKYGKQAEKDRLSEFLFSAKNATDNNVSKCRAVNFEDEVLDKMTRHEKLIDMFVKCVVLKKERDLV